MKRSIYVFLSLVCVFQMESAAQVTESVDFESQVKPILKKHCASCHNDEDPESGFSVDSVESILGGSVAGPAIKEGDPAASHIIKLMRGTEEPVMPPIDDFDRVPQKEIAIVENWIAQGARTSIAKSGLVIAAPGWALKAKTLPPVLAADWSKQADLIATAQYGVVKLLDAESLEAVHEFEQLPGKVNAINFSCDGGLLIAASGIAGVGGRAFVWNVKSRELVAKLDGHSDVMYDAVLSPNGKLAATSAYDRTILLWDLSSGTEIRKLKGHNSAIYDLDFSPDSKNLISASDDQTLKVWNTETGQRLDTLGQPLKEQFVATFSPDGKMIVGGGRDNRLRVWRLESTDSIAINPLLFSRFAHEGSIVRLKFSADGSRLFSSSEDLSIKVWETDRFQQVGVLADQPEVCSAMAISPDGGKIFLGRMDGSIEVVNVPVEKRAVASAKAVLANEAYRGTVVKAEKKNEVEPNNSFEVAQTVSVPSTVSGLIKVGNDVDLFRFSAVAGQSLMIETRAARDKSPLDTKIEVLHVDGSPVPQVVLRAVRDSWFTFRGKDSSTIDDYRVHNWQEMKLNEYLYAGGEVNRLFLHPRGPDSGFRVYPGSGKRFGYFGTTPVSHALQEPCYIVEPWPPGTEFVPNGLPVFPLNYENDDDSRRELGTDSRLKFVAPADGDYLVRVTDVRGFGGERYRYELTVRESNPDYEIQFKGEKNIFPASGREFRVIAKRKDGFEGAIRIDVENVPEGFHITSPLMIEANHIEAVGAIYALDGANSISQEQADAVTLKTSATISGHEVTRDFHGFSEMKLEEKDPKIKLVVVKGETDPFPDQADFDDPVILEIRPGESIQAHVVARRIRHDGRISMGQEGSGRNLPHGIYVDDIGLNGLMITQGNVRQRFFIKAESFVQPQVRTFHLKANDVDNLVTPPVLLKVLPAVDRGMTGR